MSWSITVVRQPPEEYGSRLTREAVLAYWKVGIRGIRWIEELVARGEAEWVKHGSGLPDLYTAKAVVIVPLLAGDEPPSGEVVSIFKPRDVIIKHDALARCAPDETLTIAVWDQS